MQHHTRSPEYLLAVEAESVVEIGRLRAAVEDKVAASLAATGEASAAADQLVGDQVYDVEYAETTRGADVREHLRLAALHLRAAQAVAADAARMPQ